MPKKRSEGDIERLRKDVANTTKQLNRIYERDGGICQLCNLSCNREDASRDHIKEIHLCTKEEARSDDNVVLAHRKCNEERSAKLRLEEFIAEHGKLPRQGLKSKIGDLLSPEQIQLLNLICESD
jgi:5-methylcytosine-specific restriction endonuclease McrA